ncbi:unnamed protein product, partial [Bubo scandiacus]
CRGAEGLWVPRGTSPRGAATVLLLLGIRALGSLGRQQAANPRQSPAAPSRLQKFNGSRPRRSALPARAAAGLPKVKVLPKQPRGPARFASAPPSSAPCAQPGSGHGSAARRGATRHRSPNSARAPRPQTGGLPREQPRGDCAYG